MVSLIRRAEFGTGQAPGAVSDLEWQMRVDLAACYRLVAHFGLNELTYNHISARVPGPGEQ
ncbi:MAG TPA: hypothetical protein VJ859_14210, partial [Allosphingosinicella sp.]|nr:hypothetical protein [Allosphingosinicella sp.]